MKIISWNLNGLLANINRNAFDVFYDIEPEILCCQEIKTPQEPEILPGYEHFWNHARCRENYSGTVTLADTETLSVSYELGEQYHELNQEGRVITLELPDFFVVNTYMPNSIHSLERKNYRMEWDDAFFEHIMYLKEKKPLVICGDFNTTMSAADTFETNTRQMWAEKGYPSEERSHLMNILDNGFADAFRCFYPTAKNQFTYWSARFHKRDVNDGWRLDYFFVSLELMQYVKAVKHLTDVSGSDHCPIEIEIDM